MAAEKRTDPQGYEVILEDERWAHILEGHPEMQGLRDLILLTWKNRRQFTAILSEHRSTTITGFQGELRYAGMICT